jgi:hypothetical protein
MSAYLQPAMSTMRMSHMKSGGGRAGKTRRPRNLLLQGQRHLAIYSVRHQV